jgi:hypothetical protein
MAKFRLGTNIYESRRLEARSCLLSFENSFPEIPQIAFPNSREDWLGELFSQLACKVPWQGNGLDPTETRSSCDRFEREPTNPSNDA